MAQAQAQDNPLNGKLLVTRIEETYHIIPWMGEKTLCGLEYQKWYSLMSFPMPEAKRCDLCVFKLVECTTYDNLPYRYSDDVKGRRKLITLLFCEHEDSKSVSLVTDFNYGHADSKFTSGFEALKGVTRNLASTILGAVARTWYWDEWQKYCEDSWKDE